MTSKLSKYEEQANKLAKAVDIAEQVIRQSADFNSDLVKPMLDFGTKVKHMALNPEPQFKKLVSLKYLENDFFIFWNESTGPDVAKFWDRVFESKLGYDRKDAIQAVLKRKKIKNIHEFDFITDNIVVYKQTGRLRQDQVNELNKYIGEFEKRESGK
jgi:hypothetical protein